MEKTNKQIGFLLLGIKFYYRGILDIVRAALSKALKFLNFHLKFWIVWLLFSMLILIGVYFLWEYVNSSTAAKDSSSHKVTSSSDSSSKQNQSAVANSPSDSSSKQNQSAVANSPFDSSSKQNQSAVANSPFDSSSKQNQSAVANSPFDSSSKQNQSAVANSPFDSSSKQNQSAVANSPFDYSSKQNQSAVANSPSDSSSKQNQSVEEFAKFIISFTGQVIWWVISYFGLSIGLYLALWGRIMHHRLHLNERYKDAAIMLGNESMIIRIAGCRFLRSLGIDDKSMKERSVRLLFYFINDFYLTKEHQNKKLEKIFSKDDILKLDIQEAIRSFSFIYRHYRSSGIDNQLVDLPPGFWQSRKKGRISLIKANLMHEILQDAYLYEANLYGANLSDANLQGANLSDANLQGANLNRVDLTRARLCKTDFRNADITDAIMDNVENLTKEQILSAKWGLDKKGKGEPPLLKEELRDDSDIQKWLTSPHYNEKEKLKKHE